jgi:hypothetical protein
VVVAVVPSETVCLHLVAVEVEAKVEAAAAVEVVVISKQVYFFHLGVEAATKVEAAAAVEVEVEVVVVISKQVYFFHLGVEAAAKVEATVAVEVEVVVVVVVVVVRKQVCYQLVVEVVVEEEVDTQAVWTVNCYSAALAVILSVVHFARLWTQMNAKGSKISPELEVVVVQTEEVSCSSRE